MKHGRSEGAPLWSIEDLAKYLSVPVQDVQDMVTQRSIPHFKIGEHVRFQRLEIDQWLHRQAVPCLDRAARPLVSLEVSHSGSKRSRVFPLDVSASVPPTAPWPEIHSTSSSPLPLQRSTKRLPPVAAPHSDDEVPDEKYLQELVRQAGEENGFHVTLNEMVPGGRRSVDVALERDGWRLACEISVTSNLEEELASIRKCLESGFHEVAMVLPSQRQARKLENVLTHTLTKEESARVRLLRPEEIPGYIEGITTVVAERETMVGRYKVKVKYVRTNPADEARRSRALAEVMARVLRRELENAMETKKEE